MRLFTFAIFLFVWVTNTFAQYQTGTTAVSQLPMEQQLELFRDLNGNVPTALPYQAEYFLRYKGGLFNSTFTYSQHEMLVNGVPTKHPNYNTLMNQRSQYHAKEHFGYPANGVDWRSRHNDDKVTDDLLATSLNLYFNLKKTPAEWGVDDLTEAERETYLAVPELWPGFESIIQKLVKEGPLMAEIVPFHLDVWIVGYEFDKYGNLVLIFKNHFGNDWGLNGYGKMLAMDFSNFRQISVADLALAFGSSENVLCSNNDADNFCSWGLAPRPEDCSCAEVLPDCHDRNTSVMGEDLKLTCLPNSAPNFPNSDLVVLDIALDSANEQVTMTYKNQGTQTIGGSGSQFMLMLMASPDPYWGGSGSGGSAGTILAGETKVMTVSYSQLGITQSNSYRFTATVDLDGQIDEAVETNNVLIKDINISVPEIDLVVTDIVLNASGDFLVSFKNQGLKNPVAGAYDYLHLVNAANMNYYNYIPVSVPAAGQTLTQVFSKDTFYLQPGQSYSMVATIDYYTSITESNETNNSLTKTITMSSPGPDFIVDDIYVSGNQLRVSIRNNGTSYTPQNWFYFRVVVNGYNRTYYYTFPQANQQIAYAVNLSDFGLGSVSGIYSVTATADSSNNIPEGNESNNALTKNVTVTAPAMPDLIVNSITFDGTNFNVTYKNNGLMAASYSYQMVQINGYYSSYYIASLAAGASVVASFNRSSFNLLNGSTYTVNAWADYYGYITESNELNNAATQSITIPMPASYLDLIVNGISVSGTNLVISVKNQGTGSSTLTHNLRVNGNGINRYYAMTIGGAGVTTTRTIPFSDLSLIGGGSYTILAVADNDLTVSESNEVNNSYSQSVVLPNNSVDLIVSDILYEGGLLKVKIRNQGTGTNSNYHDIIVAGNGYSRGYYQQVPGPGAELIISIPPGDFGFTSAAATVTLSATADYYGAISETNESNNQLAKSVVYPGGGASGVDLVILDISRYTYSTSTIYAVVRFKNQGTGSSSGTFKIKLEGNGRIYTYSSSILIPSPGAESSVYIPVGSSQALWMQYGYNYYITGTIDSENAVIESNESNNVFNRPSF